MKISVLLMIENEDHLFEHWYNSVKHYADEIIVGCIGERPRQLPGVKYIDYPKDTCAAKGMYYVRNDIIRYATGDWIISLDTDEVMATTREHLVDILTQATTPVLATNTFATGGSPCSIDEAITREVRHSGEVHRRIFRNIPGMHWVGTIHEELYYNGGPPRDLQPIETIGMIHYGPSLHKKHRYTVYGELVCRQNDISGLNGPFTRKFSTEELLDNRVWQKEFWKERNGILIPGISKNPYASHRRVLELAIERFKPKHILEIGVGKGSTPFLQSLGIKLSSFETNEMFQYPNVNYLQNYDQIPDDDYDLVFIDHAPVERRNVEIERFKDRICVVHDTEANIYNYRLTIGEMKYVYTDCTEMPWTTVCSNTVDVTNLSYGFNTYVPVDWNW